MSLRSLFAACTLLVLCSADQTFSTVNSMLDPNRICWWRTKWAASPITLSVNNRSRNSIVTFFISPTTSITSGVLEITFPTGFTLPTVVASTVTVSGQIYTISGQTFVGGQDYAVAIPTAVTNPTTVGAYGPFSLRTRYNAGGQQVDVNLAFGCVYIYGDAGTLGNLNVKIVGAAATGTVINKSGNTLSFTFTIAQSLWRYDTFVISTDSRWTIASGATCSSYDYPGKWNNFNGTSSTNPHALQCFIVSKTTGNSQTAYIYGLAVDGVDVGTTDNQSVELRITSVTSPDAVYSGSTYSWTVSTYRFQTATNLETATYASGPLVGVDAITTATWVPTWGMSASDMVNGSSYFMDLSFTITNALPAAATISITVTEDVTTGDALWTGTAANNCYIVTYLKGTTCTLTTNNIKLTGLPALTAGFSIKLRNIVAVTTAASGSAKITSIYTYQDSASAIQVDVGTSLATFTVASSTSYTLLSAFSMFFTSTTTATAATSTGGTATTTDQAIQYYYTSTGIPTSPTFKIWCPFTSAIDDFGIGIASPVVMYLLSTTTTAISFAAGGSPTTITTSVTFSPSSSSTSHGTFSTSTATAITVNTHYYLSVTTGGITLPRISNNLATAYECRAELSGTSAAQRRAIRFSVTASGFGTKTVTGPCTSAFTGFPLMITYGAPTNLAITASTTGNEYYVEFSFTATMASGLSPTAPTVAGTELLTGAVAYPHYSSVTGSAARYYNSGTSNYIAVKGMGGHVSTATSAPYVYFPVGGMAAGALAVTLKYYYIQTSDPRYQFVSHSDTASYTLTAGISTTFASFATAAPLVIGSSNSMVNGNTSTLTLDIQLVGTATAVHYYAIVMPTGYSWSTSPSVKSIASATTTQYSGVYYFNSPTTAFAYPGVLVLSTVSTTNYPLTTSNATTGSFIISGITLPLGTTSVSSPAITIVAGPNNTGGTACLNSSSISLTVTAGAVSSVTVSPTTVKQRGPDGINIKHVVSFTLAHGIPAGGSIVMVFASDWTSTSCSTTCVVTGVTAATGGTLGCNISANTATVSGFADFSTTTSSTAITIEVNNLLPPVSVTTTGIQFVSSINTYVVAGGSNNIDTISSVSTTAVTVTATSAVGNTTWTTKKTFPLNAGATATDLYLKFSLPHTLPKCGVITLSSPMPFKLSGTSVKNSCFLSPIVYSDCSISSNNLVITLAADYTANTVLELYLDAAVDNPSSTTTTTTGFSIATTWGGVAVDTDPTTIGTTQTFTASAILTSTITPTSTTGLSFAPKTAGETATYTFDFKDSVNFAVGDQYWIVFPPQYDYFLGDVWTWLTNESNVYYIECSSTQLGTTWCSIDHNIVVVTGSNAITGSTQIVINIQNVVNPVAAQTSAFQIYHVNANGDFLTVNQNYGTVTPTAFAGNLDIRSLDQTDRRIFKTSDMKWRLYITDTMNTDSQLKVLFPREYDLSKFDKKDSYSCSSTWYDNSASATIKTQQNWNSASSCTASGNWITLASPTTSITFTASNIITWTIQSVGNPQWGQSRTAFATTQDFDVTDSVLWPIDPMWASKFTFFVYRSSATNLAYTSRSYPNMNAAYAGFYQGYRSIVVNGYGPQSKTNRIVVYAGTQTTDLYIATASATLPLASKQIVFTPTTNSRTPDSGKLKYTSAVANWILFQSWWRIQFRVAAGIDMVKGLYYIDWSNNETKQSGLNDVQYDIPVSTLVEVIAKKAGQYVFAVSTIPNISTGYTSVPIKIAINNAPHTDCTVNISVSGTPANISITPTAITFGPDVNAKYFQIQVASNYDLTLGTVQTLLFTLTGTDAYSFSIVSSLKFTITQSSTTITPGNVVSWGLGQPTKTSITAAPSSDQTGVIYYQLAAAGTAVPSFSSLKSSVTALVGANTTNSSPSTSEGSQTESDPQTGETWIDFQRRIYKSHLEETWTGVISMFATTAVTTLTFNWLYAATTYQISGYLDNLSSSTTDPTVRTETFTTTAVADCQPFAVKFQGLVAQSFSSKISQEAANAQGVNPLRLYNPVYATSTSRALQTTGTTTDTVAFSTFTYTLLPNRFSESPSPTDQAKISGTSLTSFTAALKTAGITNSLNSVANGAIPSRVTPQWTASPSSGGSTTNSVTVTLRSNVAGQSCCVALTGTTTSPTPEQVMLGLDSTNTATTGMCITNDLTATTNSVQVSNLQAGTTYYVYCSATDSYPMWPTQMAYSTTNPMTPVSITTLSTGTTTTTNASYFGGLFLLLALLLH